MSSSEAANSKGNSQAKSATPGYLSYRADGVFINLQKSYTAGGFLDFVNKLFSGDSRFENLDYGIFLKLLYDADWLLATQVNSADIKIASGIVHFPPHRKEIYRPIKVLDGGRRAEYVFEPVSVTVTYEEPVYGEAGANGVAPIIGQTTRTAQKIAKLDFDEFVAAMWEKGVKYGINAEVVNEAIAAGKPVRVFVADYLPPTQGHEAYIQELSPDLHRDNSPKTLANGKTDLRAFQNRFPHISKGTRLLKKVPRILGKQGYKVTGEAIEPPMPKDLNLLALTSNGTDILTEGGVDYIVALMDGFLTIDPEVNLISIAEKIETKGGISMKTTGDLSLGVEEFVEHGEVQEGRIVKGKHMTFKSNVFGNLVSSAGNIIIEGNLTGGGAETSGGNITLNRASRAIVRAQDGEVTAKHCENSTIIARTINIEHAVNCELIANEVNADAAEGCMIAAEKIKLVSGGESKNKECLVTILLPDLSGFDKIIGKFHAKIVEAQAAIAARNIEIQQLKSDPDFAKYLSLSERISSGAIKLTSEQAASWQIMVTKNTKASIQFENFNKQILGLEKLIKETQEELAIANKNRDETGVGIGCVIDSVTGQTTGYTLKSSSGMKIFNSMSPPDIKNYLQKADPSKERIFSEDDGSINWSYK